ncbi:MAG: ABC transporter permease [Chitinophagaceae bacterium]
MFKNYLKTAMRSLWRNKQFTLLNIGGLAIGIAVFIFIMEYVADEWNANRFNQHYSDTYRINIQSKEGNSDYQVPPGYAPLLKNAFPAIENYTRLADGIASGVVARTDSNGAANLFREDNIVYVDSGFLKIFSFPLIAGSPSLYRPNTLALSETMSRKLFGNTDVVGKTIKVSNQFGSRLYTIAAVYQLPATSDIKAEVLLSIHTLEDAANRDGNDWADPNGIQSSFTSVYLQVKKNTNVALLEKNIKAYISGLNENTKNDIAVLQPMANLHLAPNFTYPLQTYGNLLLVTVFSGIALLILLLAWVNYINLSTAQSLVRARETGVRKVLGASRRQLALQYLAETLVLTFIAGLLAIVLVNLFQESYNIFSGRNLSIAVLNHAWIWLCGIILILAGSLLSGSYVAFVLTSFNPISIISGKIGKANNGFSVRKALVVFQFTVSISLIIATVIIYKQLTYMQQQNLGMDLHKLLVIEGPTVTSDGQAKRNLAFKNSLAQLPFVTKYAASNNVPGVGYNFSADGISSLASTQPEDKKKSYAMFIGDEHFFDTYGISFVQGKAFSTEDAQASWNKIKKVIINEKAAASLGFNKNDNIIGKKIMWGVPYEIVGVVKDYHHLSLREAIQPTIYLASVSYGFFTIQTSANNMPAKISQIKKLYASTFPGNPFEYFFADQKYDRQYKAEQQIGNVFIAAAFIAILIASLGLYGLTAFSASQRVKEIGIRKVLGASVPNVVGLLSKDFIKLVAVALIIAAPIAWWCMQYWLQSFAYRTMVNWWVFALAGVIALAIALVTISFHAIRAALANPVKSLRNE